MCRGTSGLKPALRDPQDEAPICTCERCRGEIYQGEMRYIFDDKKICPDCFQAEIEAWVSVSPREVAIALGVEMEEV